MPEGRTIGLFGGKFSPLHNGHLAAIVEASTRVDQLHVVVITDEVWEREHLYTNSKAVFFDSRHRARWLRRAFKDHPHVRVHVVHQPTTGNNWADWRVGREAIRQSLGDDDDTIPENYPRIAVGHFLRVEAAAEHTNRVLGL
ncbi:adenylyltransferase/cytidyltransferase family protein [Actinomyces trachealis]|uniref:adenylyltransferase/cytidyltransferase family protein n=1 Tax=Actinomyces trachealis TaxID=2763540 RepID=UPI001892AC42|nr:adenylyltransferase/cytidyltransferase family protein [Actinomyces trachealis]